MQRTRPRRSLAGRNPMNRIPPRRPRFVRLATGAVATLCLVTAGCNGAFSPGTARSTGGLPGTAPPPSAPLAPQALGSADVNRPLAPGTYQVGDPFGVPTTVPVTGGWKLDHVDQGDLYIWSDDAWLEIDILDNVFADPCHSAGGPIQPPVAPTVDAIVAALSGMAGFTAASVSVLTVGEHAGKAFDLQNAIATDSAGCYQIDRLPMWTNGAG